MNKNGKNVPLIIALSIPVLMVTLIAVSIYLPTMFVKPQFDFIYSTDDGYCHYRKYLVINSKIIEEENQKPTENNVCKHDRNPRLYYYDIQLNTPKEITLEEAQKFFIDNRAQSPDGFEIVSGDRSFDIFFFSGSSYYDKYLKKGTYTRKLNTPHDYYYYDFRLIGWVKES